MGDRGEVEGMRRNPVPELRAKRVTARPAALRPPEAEADYSAEEYRIYMDVTHRAGREI